MLAGLPARRRLATRGDADELHARVGVGEEEAAAQLARLLVDLLIRKGRKQDAEQLRRFGLNPDGAIASA